MVTTNIEEHIRRKKMCLSNNDVIDLIPDIEIEHYLIKRYPN